MRWLLIAPLVLCLMAAGCSHTREMRREERYRMTTLVRTQPPGYDAYLGKVYLGKTPVKVNRDYSHLTEELTFGSYRTGMALVISGGIGMAVAGSMVAGGAVALDDGNDAGPALMSLGVVGLLYGFIGTIYGSIAMASSTGPKEVQRTKPYTLTFGVKSPSGVYREMTVKPISDKKRHYHFDELREVLFTERTGKWWVPGLKHLKVEKKR